MEAAGASGGFCIFFCISFWGSCWLEEEFGEIGSVAPEWLCPALFLPQGPGWQDSSGAWGRGGWQWAPATASHRALATELPDPVPLVPAGHRDCWGAFPSC